MNGPPRIQPPQQIMTGSNDDRFTLSSWVGNAQHRISEFFGQDRNVASSQNAASREQITTPQSFGKKKASSPLDADLTHKKYKEGESDAEM